MFQSSIWSSFKNISENLNFNFKFFIHRGTDGHSYGRTLLITMSHWLLRCGKKALKTKQIRSYSKSEQKVKQTFLPFDDKVDGGWNGMKQATSQSWLNGSLAWWCERSNERTRVLFPRCSHSIGLNGLSGGRTTAGWTKMYCGGGGLRHAAADGIVVGFYRTKEKALEIGARTFWKLNTILHAFNNEWLEAQ